MAWSSTKFFWTFPRLVYTLWLMLYEKLDTSRFFYPFTFLPKNIDTRTSTHAVGCLTEWHQCHHELIAFVTKSNCAHKALICQLTCLLIQLFRSVIIIDNHCLRHGPSRVLLQTRCRLLESRPWGFIVHDGRWVNMRLYLLKQPFLFLFVLFSSIW